MTANVPIYLNQGGTTLTVGEGAQVITTGLAQDVAFSIAAGGSNVCEVTITVKDGLGDTVPFAHNLDVWLSDDNDGEGLTATTASGTVTAKASSGAVFGTYTAKKALRVQTNATGVFVLEITDSAKTGFYVAVVPSNFAFPFGTGAFVSRQLVTGDYG